MESNKDTNLIKAVLLLEIIGRPPEHLIESLEAIIKRIDEEKGVKVKEKKIKEPVLIKEQKDFYTTFAEVEVEIDEIMSLVILMFKYMPAHVEVVYPELIAITNQGWGDILSELTRRLHGYDEIARVLSFENKKLKKQLEEMLGKGEPKKEKVNKARNKKVKDENKPEKKRR
ncbi:hypothetical protein J4225_03715 [Candidatus Pacearchaeota archaeon]|nr:hypothetical protein [Candidatus Pacearchaeota archaeon]